MKKASLLLDGKGIIAPDTAGNEDDYIDYGLNVLEASARFGIDEDVIKHFKKERISLKKHYAMPASAAETIRQKFGADLSWLAVITAVSSDPLDAGRATCVPYVVNDTGIFLPVTLYFKGNMETLVHECVHVIRIHIAKQENMSFEEAFANYFVVNPEHAAVGAKDLLEKKILVSTVRRKLEDKLMENGSYALIRMSMEEVYGVRDSSDALSYVKGLDTLRMKIVKEKLGI